MPLGDSITKGIMNFTPTENGSFSFEKLDKGGSVLIDIADFIFFPIRALFFHEEGKFGLSSLREQRMRMVAQYCKGKVLDVGCGPGNVFIERFIGKTHGVGIDVFPYEGVEFVSDDLTKLPFEDRSFDTVTLIAVGGHIPKSKRMAEFREFARLLKPNGLLIMTEGEPVTQFIVHKWAHFYYGLFNKKDMDSQRGMEENEEYCMPRDELLSYLNMYSLQFVIKIGRASCRERV